MPLSKARMRELSQQRRDATSGDKPTTPATNLDKPNKLELARQVLANFDKPKTDILSSNSSPLEEESTLPLFNRNKHKKGDLVRMPGSNIPVIVPDLDSEGNAVPEYY